MSFTGDRMAWSSGSVTIVTGTLAAAQVLAQSQDRAGLKFFNNTNQDVLIGYHGAGQLLTPGRHSQRIASASFYESPRPYIGPISVVWNIAPTTGSLFITEMF